VTAEVNKPNLPDIVADDEIIVRALKTPSHYDFKKNRLKPAAFRAPPEQTVISVARSVVGVTECKTNINRAAEYVGFGAIYAGSIRHCGSAIVDAPADYYGHAHIEHPDSAPKRDEPQESEANLRYITRLRNLIELTHTHLDQNKDEIEWGGPDPLTAPPTP